MDKDQLINDFFRSLRATLTNSFSYPQDHPYFIKSVENFSLRLAEVLSVIAPFRIGITNNGVVVDGKNLTQAGFYDELAKLLHRRKIKSIEIYSGVTLQELVSLFAIISRRQDEIVKNGGITALLSKQPLPHILIEELDYSVFLHENGELCPDVWGYMLAEALRNNDETKIDKLADNFSTLIKRSSQNDILENQEIPAMLRDFLLTLKSRDKEKFNKCSQDIFLWLLHDKQSITEEKLNKFVQIFDSLSQDDLSSLFLEGVAQEENFDALSLELFSKISAQKNPAQVARGVLDKAGNFQGLNNNPRAAKHIQNLLSGSGDSLSAVYRNTLETLVKGISFSGELFFDQKTLRDNYRYIVLNILASDDDQDNLLLAAEILEKELTDILKEANPDLLKDIWALLVKRRKDAGSLFTGLEKQFSALIENLILTRPLDPETEFLLEMVAAPTQSADFYLDKIFAAEKANKHILGLFFRFFPGNLDIFYAKVELKLHDLEFIFSLIQALSQLNAPLTLGILDHLYSSSNEIIKIEILNNMRKLKKVDAQFLLRQLNTPSPRLRKNLLSVLVLDPQATDGALDLLLKITGFCGRNNERLIENIQIVFDLGLIEAAGRIYALSRRKFFWNSKLRKKAKQILKDWNA